MKEEEMKRRNLFVIVAGICLVLLLTPTIFITACAEETPAPTPTPAPAPETPQVIKLKYAEYDPPTADIVYDVNIHEWWAGQVAERTGGKVEVEVFFAEALCKSADSFDALDNGIADIAHIPVPAFPARLRILSFISDGPVCHGNGKLFLEVIDRLMYANLLPEYDGYQPIFWLGGTPGGYLCIFTTDKKITQMEDLKGLKIRARGDPTMRVVEGLGATPVAISTGELYMSLERGIIDGLTTPWGYIEYGKLYEVTNYCVDYGISGSLKSTIMTDKLWNSLPAEVQVVLLELKKETENRYLSGSLSVVENARKHFIEYGGEIIKLNPDEAERWRKVFATAVDVQAAELEADGLPMKQILGIIEEAIPGYDY
jgi:TRAP-type C4-dicarboxylate transport system substrate-binding protein